MYNNINSDNMHEGSLLYFAIREQKKLIIENRQREQIFLTVKCSCNIECMLVPLMSKVVSSSQ